MLTAELLSELRDWYHSYTDSFLTDQYEHDRNIILKIEHSLRVRDHVMDIARSEKMDDGKLYLVELMGLFHDIGRFEQYSTYRTFSDSKSVNHAGLGISVIKKLNVFKNIEVSDRKMILSAIAYHNLKNLPACDNKELLHLSKMLRDADKLDILKVVTDYYKSDETNETIGLNLPDNDFVSDSVIECILRSETIDYRSLKSLNDFKLLQMAWVNDLHFSHSKKVVKEKSYLSVIYETLPKTDAVKMIYEHLLEKN